MSILLVLSSIICKTVNLVNILGWLRGCWTWTEKLTWYVTCWHYGSLALWRSCAFGETVKRCSINSTPRIEFSCTKATYRSHGVRSRARVTEWGHVQGLCTKVMCREYASCSEWSAFTNRWSYNSAESSSQT